VENGTLIAGAPSTRGSALCNAGRTDT
jgi:hypothetical protein